MPDYDDIIQATLAVRDQTTSAADLAAITQTQPSLWADVARHPNAYPALLDWLSQAGDDTVRQAIRARRDNAATQTAFPTPGSTPLVGQTDGPVPAVTPETMATATTGQSPSFLPPNAGTDLIAPNPWARSAPTAAPSNPAPPNSWASSTSTAGPQTTPGVTWARPDATADSTPKKKPRKKTVITISIVVAVVALALVAWFVARPALFPPGPGVGDYAPDLTTEPVTSAPTNLLSVMDQTWTQYYSVSLDDPATDGLGLAYIDVNYEKYSNYTTSGWYEGYDQDYDDGYKAGVACAAVPEPSQTSAAGEWFIWEILPAMYCSRYINPPIGDYTRYSSGKTGYADGFGDGMIGAEGSSRIKQPEALGETSKLVGFSLSDGSIAWTYDLGETGATHARGMDAIWATSGLPNETPTRMVVANGSGRIALVVADSEDATAPATLVVLNATDGAVVSSTTVPLTSRVAGYVDSSVLVWSADSSGVALTAYSDDGGTKWTHASSLAKVPDETPFQVISHTWVGAGDTFVNLTDGSAVAFGSDLADGAQYIQTPDGSVWRTSDDDLFAREFTKWDVANNKSTWTTPITVSSAVMSPDATTLYDLSGGQLTAYRLSDGKQLWSVSVDSEQLLAATANTVVTSGFGQGAEAFDASSRSIVGAITSPLALDQPTVYCGRSTIYVHDPSEFGGSFAAFDASDPTATPLWSITSIEPGSTTELIGDTFVTLSLEGKVRVLVP